MVAPSNADVAAGKHLYAGKTILEQLWEQAVLQYDRYYDMTTGEPETYIQQGKLTGLAYAIAKLLNPSKPDVPDVKRQILEQWQAEYGDEEDDD